MSIDELVKEIDALNPDEKQIVLRKIQDMLTIRRKHPVDIAKYKGIAKGLWDMDAQDYVTGLRNDDRL